MVTRARYFLVPMLLNAVLFAPAKVLALTWTYVGAACMADDGSADMYQAIAARFRHKSTHTGDIFARCNVTNPMDPRGRQSGNPNWDSLEVVYRDPPGAGNQVTAELVRVSNRSGGIFTLATFDSNCNDCEADPDSQTSSVHFIHEFDFDSYAYYVLIKVARTDSDPANNPDVSLVRLKSTAFGDDVNQEER